jgi:thiamine-phosphate pyrophosphorylase
MTPAGNDHDRATVMRILDANANRCAEGLRVVEEIARFSMQDPLLQARLKEMRHEIRRTADFLSSDSLESRDSESDIGRQSATTSELARGSIGRVARANFARAEEALRVLEEFGKCIDPEKARRFKSLRFELYSIEKRFFGRGEPARRMPASPFLYAILDRCLVPHEKVSAVAALLVEGGVDLLQYRAKETPVAEMRNDLRAVLAAVRRRPIPVLVNDEVELAVELGADGVHVGAHDMPPREARDILGPDRIVGVTVHTLEELDAAPLGLVDYVAVGAVFPSPTKPSAGVVGIEFVELVRSRVDGCLVAIGGITASNAAQVLEAGADGIAVVSGLLEGDIGKNCFTLRRIIDTRLQRHDDLR